MTAEFVQIEPGYWEWGEYAIEYNEYGFTLYRGDAYLWDCDEFETAVELAIEDAAD